MYRVLIVDDEQIVLDSMKYIINNYFKEIDLRTVNSGRKAIVMAGEFKPDIVFMDIKMPGINGIEAIKEIKSINKDTIFLIITAHDEFDFAREAVELGVINYLLKPVSKEKVIRTISDNINKIKQDRIRKQRVLELREKYEYILPILEYGFIYSIIFFNENNEEELSTYKEVLRIGGQAGFIMVVEYNEQKENIFTNRVDLSFQSQSFQEHFRAVIKGICRCIVGPVMLNRMIVFIPVDKDYCQEKAKERAIEIARSLHTKLAKRVNKSLSIGIGNSYSNLQEIYHSYEEAVTALKYGDKQAILHAYDLPRHIDQNSQYSSDLKQKLLDNLSSGRKFETLDLFNYIFKSYSKEIDHFDEFKYAILEIMVMIQNQFISYYMYSNEKSDRYKYIKELMGFSNKEQIQNWCIERMDYITTFISKLREDQISKLVKNAQAYIENNYKTEVTLDDVAREINISPNYFSKLFKEETGENFIKYLTSIRMKKAKKLLKENKLSVKEISNLIGYNDPNYFSRLFKKMVGVTPTEYQGRLF